MSIYKICMSAFFTDLYLILPHFFSFCPSGGCEALSHWDFKIALASLQ